LATEVISVNPSVLMDRYAAKSMRLVAACFILSGATGLIYEVLWARMLGLVFGATTLAVSTVLAAFMGGLALGSALAGRMATRIKRPIRTYGLLEIGIAIYALGVPFLFALADDAYALLWQYFHLSPFVFSVFRFLLSCSLLLIPTTLMGATLPLLSAALLRSSDANSTSITRLYTRNLVGAIVGCVVAGFVLLPAFGVRATILTASLINMIIGGLAFIAERGIGGGARQTQSQTSSVNSATHVVAEQPAGSKFWLLCAFVSGFVTISTQVAWTRMLSMIIGSSTYAFSITVALFLVGLSAGAFFVARRSNAATLRKSILTVELLTAVSLVFSLFLVNRIPGWLVNAGIGLNIASWSGLLSLQIASVALLILLPALLMGMVMPLVLEWAGAARGNKSVQLVGRSYAVNTVGAIAGAFCAGFVLIPKTSTRFTILFAAALCVVVAGLAYPPVAEQRERSRKLVLHTVTTVALLVMIFVFAPPLHLANLSVGAYDSLIRTIAKTRGAVAQSAADRTGPGEHTLLMYEEGPTSTVSVRKDWEITSLAINGRINASDREDMPTQVMVGQLPILVAPNLRNSLVVGFASGVSVGSILQSQIQSLECVELEPATVAGSRYFEHVNNRPLDDPRMQLIIDDARTYLRVTPNRYDIIVSEPSHPWVPGVANLFTREFFTLGRDRLAEGGVFVQWVQIYQMSTESLRSVLATFHETFPYVQVFRVEGATKGKDLILVGSQTALSLNRVNERLTDSRVATELKRIGINNEADVKSWYVCDQTQLAPAVAGAVINTDDNMHVETTVPREAFQPLMQSNSAWIERLVQKSSRSGGETIH
jgi:spermidine synthase